MDNKHKSIIFILVLLIISVFLIATVTAEDVVIDKTKFDNKTDILKDPKLVVVKPTKTEEKAIIDKIVLDYNKDVVIKTDATNIIITKVSKYQGLTFTYFTINGVEYTKISMD